VPGATEPVIGADIGVSLVIYDLVTDGEGATVEIDPPLSGTMNPGDVMELWLLGETTFLYSKIIEDENAITTLRIPKGRLHADRINELFYIIKRGSNNIGTSPMLTMLYNKIRPGLKDRFPEVEGHSELELLLPDAIKNGVGPDFVSAQVCVSYPYCRAYDTITLKCNGESTHFIVGRDEAPEPPDPGSPIATRVCFTVTRAHLEVAQRPNHELNFSYTVTDQLGNVPDTDAIWSATQTVEEDLAGTRLPAAILREILSEADDESGTIDLGKLGAYLYVIILVRDPRFEVGDFIEATYTGQSPGLPDVVMTVGGNVQADEFGDPVRVVLEIPNDKVVSVQTVSVAYVLKRNGEQKYSSREAKAQVIGEGLPDLVPPTVLTSVNGVLDPMQNLQGATGRVEVQGWRDGDMVRLIVQGAPGAGSPVFTSKPLNTNNRANFPLEVAFINANMGGQPVKFSYVFTRGGQEYPSPSTDITVSRIADGDTRLPTPAIDGAVGNELDVTKMLASDQLRVGTWPLQQVGQRVWLRYDAGLDADGKPIFLEDLIGAPNDTVEGLTRPAPLDWLKTLKDGSVLTISFSVSFNGVDAVRFPLRTYTIKSIVLLQPVITSIKNASTEVGNGTTLTVIGSTDTSVTVTGTATANLEVEIFDGDISTGISVQANALGDWNARVPMSVGKHSLTAKAKYGNKPVSTPWTFNQEALWNFAASSFQGWVAQGQYQNGNLFVGNNEIGSETMANVPWNGLIMTYEIPLRAGKQYRFSFKIRAAAVNPNVNGTIVHLKYANEVIMGGGTDALSTQWRDNSKVIIATVTGRVSLGFWNLGATNIGNDFRITDIKMAEVTEVREHETPESPEEIIARAGYKGLEADQLLEEFRSLGYIA
jgi:hypothetical protein